MPIENKILLWSVGLGLLVTTVGVVVLSRALGQARDREFEEAILGFSEHEQKLLRFQYGQQKEHEKRIRNIVIATLPF